MDSELLAVVSRVPAVVSVVQAEFSGIPLGFFLNVASSFFCPLTIRLLSEAS